MITTRELKRDEIENVWSIDRREVIDYVYYFEKGGLILKPEHYDMQGWNPGEAEHYTPMLLDCFDSACGRRSFRWFRQNICHTCCSDTAGHLFESYRL